MRYSVFIFSAIFLSLVSCSSREGNNLDDFQEALAALDEIDLSESDFDSVEINDLYALSIPNHMSEASDLNDDASLEYENLYQDKYVICIDEEKDVFVDYYDGDPLYDDDQSVLDNYMGLHIIDFRNNCDVIRESTIRKEKINGYDARIVAFDATVDGVAESIAYWLCCVEGKEHLYLVMAWTSETDKQDYEKEAHKIMRSFRELN